MKIPESVRIGGVEYAIINEPFLISDGQELCGQIQYQECVISLSDHAGMSHEMQCLTLWHEIMHGIANHFDMDLEDEEKVIEQFARGVYQVLQDNGGRFFDLTEECNFEETVLDLCFDPAIRGGMQPDGGEC